MLKSDPRKPGHEPSITCMAQHINRQGHYSLVQKLQSQTHTQLPTASKLLKPEILKGIENKIQWRRQKAKQQYDKTAKELPALAVTQVVQIQPVKHHE